MTRTLLTCLALAIAWAAGLEAQDTRPRAAMLKALGARKQPHELRDAVASLPPASRSLVPELDAFLLATKTTKRWQMAGSLGSAVAVGPRTYLLSGHQPRHLRLQEWAETQFESGLLPGIPTRVITDQGEHHGAIALHVPYLHIALIRLFDVPAVTPARLDTSPPQPGELVAPVGFPRGGIRDPEARLMQIGECLPISETKWDDHARRFVLTSCRNFRGLIKGVSGGGVFSVKTGSLRGINAAELGRLTTRVAFVPLEVAETVYGLSDLIAAVEAASNAKEVASIVASHVQARAAQDVEVLKDRYSSTVIEAWVRERKQLLRRIDDRDTFRRPTLKRMQSLFAQLPAISAKARTSESALEHGASRITKIVYELLHAFGEEHDATLVRLLSASEGPGGLSRTFWRQATARVMRCSARRWDSRVWMSDALEPVIPSTLGCSLANRFEETIIANLERYHRHRAKGPTGSPMVRWRVLEQQLTETIRELR